MDNISFNVEEINYNTDYIHKLDKAEDLDVFVHYMILNNDINGLVPYVYEVGTSPQLRYSISKSILLSDFLKNKITDSGVYFDIALNLLKIVAETEEYMIEQRYLLLNNDYIFINPNTLSIKIMCVPDSRAGMSSLGRFMTDLLKSIHFDANIDCSFKTNIYEYDFEYSDTHDIIRFFSELKEKRQAPIPMVSQHIEPPLQYEVPINGIANNSSSVPSNPIGLSSNIVTKKDVDFASEPEKKQKSGGLFHFGSGKKNKAAPSFPVDVPDMPAKQADKKGKDKSTSSFASLAFPGKGKSLEEPPAMIIPKKDKKQELSALPVSEPKPEAVKIVREEREWDGSDDGSTVFLQSGASSGNAQLVAADGSITLITGDVFTIGRGGKSGIQIDMLIDSKTISRFHASIYSENGNYFITDHDSPNGTYLNNVRAKPNVKIPLMDGTKIRFSDKIYTFSIL